MLRLVQNDPGASLAVFIYSTFTVVPLCPAEDGHHPEVRGRPGPEPGPQGAHRGPEGTPADRRDHQGDPRHLPNPALGHLSTARTYTSLNNLCQT